MKQQIEDRVLEYFQNAPLAAAQAVLQLAKGVVARRQPDASNSKSNASGSGSRISAATRRKISATLKARHAAKAKGDGAAVRAASEATPKLGNGKAAATGEGGGQAPEPSASGRHRKPSTTASVPLAIQMED